jgi:hypothetical protein
MGYMCNYINVYLMVEFSRVKRKVDDL